MVLKKGHMFLIIVRNSPCSEPRPSQPNIQEEHGIMIQIRIIIIIKKKQAREEGISITTYAARTQCMKEGMHSTV